MLTSKEFDFLNVKIATINKKIYGIDRGGCGLFAVKLAKRLKKLGISSKLAIIDRWESVVDNYLEDIEELGYVDPNRDKPSHVMVKVGKRYIDNNGVFTKNQVIKDWCEPDLELDVYHFEDAAETSYGWNTVFNRNKRTLTRIDSHLNEVCKLLKKELVKKKKKKPAPKKRK